MLVVVPFWTNFLIRTYAWIVLLNTQGIVNDALVGVGIVDEPLELLYTRGRGGRRARLRLPAADDPADLRRRSARLDVELLEASANLGASRFATFLRVTLPLSLPGRGHRLASSCSCPSLGNFVVPELLGGGKTVMVGNLIRDQFLKARDWPFGATLALCMVVFLVVLFALQSVVSRRFAVEGGR